MNHFLLVLGTYSVDNPFGGGKYVLNNLFRRISPQFNIKFLSLVENDKIFKKVTVSPNFENIHIPQNTEQAEIQWELEKKNATSLFDILQINHWQNNTEYVNNVKKYLDNASAIILEHPFFANLIKSLDLKIPIIYHAHNIEFIQKESIVSDELLKDVKNAEQTACDLAQQIWVASESEKNQFIEIYGIAEDKIQLLPHGVDLSNTPFIKRELHEEVKSNLKELEGKTTFAFTGSWHPPNLESVEFIISDLSPINPDYHYFIMGSVTDYYFHEHPKATIPENVTMLGIVSDSEKIGIYKLSDFALNPMFSGAGTNIKMLEYMAMGLPVISTEFGARGINISDKTLVCTREDFVNNLKDIQNSDYKTSLSIDENYEIVREKYDYDLLSKKCILFLNNLLNTSFSQLDEVFGNVISELKNMGLSYDDPLVGTISKEIELQTKSFPNPLNTLYTSKQNSAKNDLSNFFVTFLHNKTKDGGLYTLKNNAFESIFEGTTCHGISFLKNKKILFFITRREPQMVAISVENNNYSRIPIEYSDYVFAKDAHGICIHDNKLYVMATEGDQNGEHAEENSGIGDFVGKIIISDLEFFSDHVVIKDSKIYNPFECNHHHHINDIIEINNEIYFSAFSYCDENKNLSQNGSIFKWSPGSRPEKIISNFDHPHTLQYFDGRMYVCSSMSSSIFSFDPKNPSLKLEYKGPDSFIRGLWITKEFFYFGLSEGMGRTNSEFQSTICGLLKYNRRTGETKFISCPDNCNNLYAIEKIDE